MSPDPMKPDFAQLVSLFGMQALMACGKMMNPASRKFEVELPAAQYHIGVLEILQEKTKGNLDEEEQRMLEEMLHQARMAFVDARLGRGKIEMEGPGEGGESGQG